MWRIIAREFLWFLLILVLSIPLGFVFLWILGLSTEGETLSYDEEQFIVELYLVGYVLSFVGIYLIRLIRAAIMYLMVGTNPLEVEEG